MTLDEIVIRENAIRNARDTWINVECLLAIDESVVTVVLAGENTELDRITLQYLPLFVMRKKALRAEVFLNEHIRISEEFTYDFPVRYTYMPYEKLCNIYDYYCFAFNLDNIAFTFLKRCPYNLMGRILDETDITIEEAVCLGVYWLREIPEETVYV